MSFYRNVATVGNYNFNFRPESGGGQPPQSPSKIGKGRTANIVRITGSGRSYEQITSKSSSECSYEEIAADINKRLPKRRLLPRIVLWSLILSSVTTFMLYLKDVDELGGFFFLLFIIFIFITWPFLYVSRSKKETIHLLYDISPPKEAEMQKFYEAIAVLNKSERVWFETNQKKISDTRRNAGATASVSLVCATIHPVPSKKMRTNIDVLALCAWNQSVSFFPDGIFYILGNKFYPIPYESTKITFSENHFRESGFIPSDAEKLGQTWKYVNNDGSPDKRFNDNGRIPVLRYCKIKIEIGEGLSINLITSNYETGKAFAHILHEYKNSI